MKTAPPTPRPTAPARRLFALGCACAVAGMAVPLASADWKDDVGYTRLLETFSGDIPSAITAGVALVEAGDTNGNNYLPNAADARFAGKTITNKSPGAGASGHATSAGALFFGTGSSLVPDTTIIDAYEAGDWLTSLPYAEPRRVQNHSWIVHTLAAETPDPDAVVRQFNARVDYMVNQHGVVCVAGVNNGHSTNLPYLLVQGYNLISVGLTNGQHSAGFTAYDVAGRIKPDLVAPDSLTSFATPKVSSAAALLAQKLAEAPYSLSGANIPRTVKALLLAGATKDKFPAWSRSSTQPLDTRYGAGELNVLLSYRSLLAGRQTPNQLAPHSAWTTGSVSSLHGATQRSYYFEVPAGSLAPRFSAALVWHRAVSGPPLHTPTLANLDLTLHQVAPGTFTPGAAVQTSASTVDNVEHLHAPDLAPGRYALVVSTTSLLPVDYALAWRTLPTVTVAATTPVAREDDAAAALLTITRNGPTTSPLLVPLAWSGTAVSGVHYNAPPPSLLIPAGAASATVAITPISDDLAQGDRTVVLSVANDWSFSTGASASAEIVIEDKPYDAWRFAHFDGAELADSAVSGFDADPDGDGLPNLLEYALGGEPLAPDSPTRRPTTAPTPDGHLALTYFQPAGRTDLAYIVEWTDDLVADSWTSGPGVVAETARVAIDGGELVTVRAEAALASSPRQFLRLRVTRL